MESQQYHALSLVKIILIFDNISLRKNIWIRPPPPHQWHDVGKNGACDPWGGGGNDQFKVQVEDEKHIYIIPDKHSYYDLN